MASKTFHLEIRVSTNDERNFDTVKEVMKRTARDLYAITSVAKGDGGSAPIINLYAEDWVAGKEDIDIQAGVAGPDSVTNEPEQSLGDEVL